MAKKDLARFCSEYLAEHPDVKTKMDAIADDHQFATAIAEVGKKAGFSFTEEEVEEVMRAPGRRTELSEDQLETVAGGVGGVLGTVSPGPPNDEASKGGKKHTEFLIIKMNDVIITS